MLTIGLLWSGELLKDVEAFQSCQREESGIAYSSQSV